MKFSLCASICIATLLILSPRYAYTQTYDDLTEQGREAILAERQKGYGDEPQYDQAYSILQRAVSLAPERAEAHYLLGHVYGYATCNDFSQANTLHLADVMRTSTEFEKTLELNPTYDSPLLVLSPRAKISSEWGVLAFVYQTRGHEDSAKWALREGRKRGGFTPFLCSYYTALLNGMERNALYFTYGDEVFTYALYLQLIDHVREDVLVLNTEMLGVRWTSMFYASRHPGLFSSAAIAADTVQYVEWADSVVAIPVKGSAEVFKWTVAPAYYEKYLIRSNLMFLDIFVHNSFQRPVYIEDGVPASASMGLTEHTSFRFLVRRLLVPADTGITEAFYTSMKAFPMEILSKATTHNKEEKERVLSIRSYLLFGINRLDRAGREKEAAETLHKLLQYIPENKYPYEDEIQSGFVAEMRQKYQ